MFIIRVVQLLTSWALVSGLYMGFTLHNIAGCTGNQEVAGIESHITLFLVVMQ